MVRVLKEGVELFPISFFPHSVSVAQGSRLRAGDEMDGSGLLVCSSLSLKPTLTLPLPLLTSWFLSLLSLEREGNFEERRTRTGSLNPHMALDGFLSPAILPTALEKAPCTQCYTLYCPELRFFQVSMTHPFVFTSNALP